MSVKDWHDIDSTSRRGNKKVVSQRTFLLLLCAVGWFFSARLFPATTDTYRLRVDFESANLKIIQEIDTDVLPGVPFVVRTQDSVTNRYVVSGTLWKVNEKTFQIKLGKIEWKGHGFSLGIPEPFCIDLGSNGISGFGIDGVVTEGYWVRLTKN